MAKENKSRHAQQAADAGEFAAARLVPISGRGHRFIFDGQGRTACGRSGNGWKYGTIEDVTCEECKGGK